MFISYVRFHCIFVLRLRISCYVSMFRFLN